MDGTCSIILAAIQKSFFSGVTYPFNWYQFLNRSFCLECDGFHGMNQILPIDWHRQIVFLLIHAIQTLALKTHHPYAAAISASRSRDSIARTFNVSVLLAPCLKAFRLTTAFPKSVLGPVDFCRLSFEVVSFPLIPPA